MANQIIKLKRGSLVKVMDVANVMQAGEIALALDTQQLVFSDGVNKKLLTNIEFYNVKGDFPQIGNVNKLYVAKTEKKTYYFDGAEYQLVTTELTDLIDDTSVAGDKVLSAEKVVALLNGKVDKVVGAVAENIAVFTEGGNIADGGMKISDLSTASKTETLTNKTIDAKGTGNNIQNIDIANFATGVVDTDTDLTANSDAKIPTQRAVKTYVDEVKASLVGGLNYRGAIDASLEANLPTSIAKGDFYKVSVAGTIGGLDLQIGDMIIANVEKAEAVTIADFDKIDNTEAPDILRTGDVSTNADLSLEGTKLTDRATIKANLDKKVDRVEGSVVDEVIAFADTNGSVKGTGKKLSDIALKEDLTPKANKVAVAVEDNILVQTANGDLKDGGKKIADLATVEAMNLKANSADVYVKNEVYTKEEIATVISVIDGGELI